MIMIMTMIMKMIMIITIRIIITLFILQKIAEFKYKPSWYKPGRNHVSIISTI